MVKQVNGDRLWSRLMDMARIGATAAGGCNRQALTPEDKQGRDLFCEWARNAGCEIRVDTMGNIFARRPGTHPSAEPVISGSHLDTQPTGGKFDGVYGVLSALEVIESLNDHGIETEHPVEAVVWTNEEGARFAPAMIGSGVFCGEFDLNFAHAITDKDGKSLGDELKEIDYAGGEKCEPFPIKASYEVHIEQGPILEAKDKPVGIVTGVQGMRWFDIVLEGSPVHAGPTEEAEKADVQLSIDVIWKSPSVAFDQNCLNDIRQAVELLKMPHIEMISGAGHDSVYVSRVAPTAMIFVPCERGISHNEAENADPAHLTAGANVLLHSILNSANAS